MLRKGFAVLVPGLSSIIMIVAALELGFGWMHLEVLHRPFSNWSVLTEKIEKGILPGFSNKNSHAVIAAADTYVLGANLDFLMHDKLNIYVLDHPRNIQHGRAHQYRIWDRDEQALKKNIGKDALLIIEETALKSIESWTFQRNLCALFESVDYLGCIQLKQSERRFLFLLGKNISGGPDASGFTSKRRCELGVFSYLDAPEEGRIVSGRVKVTGWAFKDDEGVSSIDIIINDRIVGTARYGIPRPDVQKAFPDSHDPHQPNVGFVFIWDSRTVKPGTVEMAIRVNTASGRHRVLNQRKITIVSPKND
jgi:hypothetical protein